jgi:hypothetical protein
MAHVTSLRQRARGTEEPPETSRHQVVLAGDTMSALRDLADRRGITLSEAVRRAISAWEFLENQRDRGADLAVVEELPNGDTKVTNVVLLG